MVSQRVRVHCLPRALSVALHNKAVEIRVRRSPGAGHRGGAQGETVDARSRQWRGSDGVVNGTAVGYRTVSLPTDRAKANVVEPAWMKSFEDPLSGTEMRNVQCVLRKPRHFEILIVSCVWDMPLHVHRAARAADGHRRWRCRDCASYCSRRVA